MYEVNDTLTDIEWQLQNAVGEVLRAWQRDGRPLGVEAAIVAVYPHESGKPYVLTATSTPQVVEAALRKVERDEGPLELALDMASGELTLP